MGKWLEIASHVFADCSPSPSVALATLHHSHFQLSIIFITFTPHLSKLERGTPASQNQQIYVYMRSNFGESTHIHCIYAQYVTHSNNSTDANFKLWIPAVTQHTTLCTCFLWCVYRCPTFYWFFEDLISGLQECFASKQIGKVWQKPCMHVSFFSLFFIH